MHGISPLAVFSLMAYATALPVRNEDNPPESTFSNATGSVDQRQGWTTSPNERGTASILWACGTTIFLCCWSMLCLNVPGPQESNWIKARRRILIFTAVLCGPEIVTIPAMGHYLSAHQSVREFATAGIANWSLQHAFFANMGGFTLQTRDWVPFPITSKQLLWLIQRRYVSISPEVLGRIKDKNKVDAVMRLIMVSQLLWFLANFFARLAQGLCITVMELTTVAFIYSSLPMMFLWRHKPADVGITELLVTEATMAEILLAGGDAAREPYMNTPLDFIDRKEWFWSIYLSQFRGLLHALKLPAGSRVRPIDRISNLDTPEIPTQVFIAGAVYYYGFTGIFIAGWNISLPTQTEQILWKVATLLCLAALFGAEIVSEVAFKVCPYVTKGRPQRCEEGRERCPPPTEGGSPDTTPSNNARRPQPRTIWQRLRNNSVGQHPDVGMKLRVMLPMSVLTFAYFVSRIYIITEDFLELRSLPRSCYQTPNWPQFIPHLG